MAEDKADFRGPYKIDCFEDA